MRATWLGLTLADDNQTVGPSEARRDVVEIMLARPLDPDMDGAGRLLRPALCARASAPARLRPMRGLGRQTEINADLTAAATGLFRDPALQVDTSGRGHRRQSSRI
jgi:hypothetical protein